jgi:hypothetical protein
MEQLTTEKRVEILKDYLTNNYPEGMFAYQTNNFRELLQLTGNSSHYIKVLLEEGFIKCVKQAERINKKWQPAEYEIIKKQKETKENNNKLDVSDYIEEKFNNMTMRLYKTTKGYVVPVVDISSALGADRQLIHQLLDNYKELFEDFLVNVTLTNKQGSHPDKCLTKDGVIGLLMKISYKRLTEDKQKLVLEFQKWAIETLSKVISEGKVELPEQEHAKIQQNIANIIDVDTSEMDLLFNKFDEDFNKFLHSTKIMIKAEEEKRILAERKADILNVQNQKWITRTQEMINKMNSLNIV